MIQMSLKVLSMIERDFESVMSSEREEWSDHEEGNRRTFDR